MNLSVIVPCLNAEATLAVQLEALATQQWSEPWELIVADNGSTDNSVSIARQYEPRFPAFRLVDASGLRRPSHAFNVGARAASSESLACCDADDEVAPGWVAAMGDALRTHDAAQGRFRFDKFNSPDQAAKYADLWKDGLYKGRFLPGGATSNLGVRRSVHEALGGFDERLPRFADADYCWRLQLEGFGLHYVPDAVVQVRIGRVNPSLSYLYRRSRNGGAASYWQYQKYRHLGMLPPPSLTGSVVAWCRLLAGTAPAVRSEPTRLAWLQQFAERTGDVVGQLQGRLTNRCTPYRPGERMHTGSVHREAVR